jgi:hypothetical protein
MAAFCSKRAPCSTSLDMSPGSSHVLVGQIGGRARLVSTRQSGNRGAVEVSYSLKEKAQAQQSEDIHPGFPGAIFAAAGQVVLFGAEDGCVVVWDRVKATVSYGLEHEKGEYYIGLDGQDRILMKKFRRCYSGSVGKWDATGNG